MINNKNDAVNFSQFCQDMNEFREEKYDLQGLRAEVGKLGSKIFCVIGINIEGYCRYMSLASLAVLNEKMRLFDVILERYPAFMWQGSFIYMDNKPSKEVESRDEDIWGQQINDVLLTPLDVAVIERKPHLVQTIMSHPMFTEDMVGGVYNYQLVINNSLDLANRCFEKTANEYKIIEILEQAQRQL